MNALYSPIQRAIYSAIRHPLDVRRGTSTPLWLRLVQEAEAAAAAAGASLWYVPPAAYADRNVNGPFVGSDGSGGVPALGSGVVGWLRDRRDPNLGSEMVGSPYSGTASGTWAVSSTSVTRNGSAGGQATVFLNAVPVAGTTYAVTFTVSDLSGDTFFFRVGAASGTAYQITANGSYTFRVPPNGTGQTLIFAPWAGSAGQATITNISVRAVPGNHATQSTSANRPVLVAAPGAAAAADGFAALSFDGSNDNLRSPSFGSVNTETLIAAFNRTSSGGAYNWRAAIKTPGTLVAAVGQTADGFLTAAVNTSGGSRTQALASAINTPFVSELEAGTGGYAWWINGASQSVSSLNATYAPSAGLIELGANSNGGELAAGRVALVCYAPSALTTAQRQAISRLGAYIIGASYPGL